MAPLIALLLSVAAVQEPEARLQKKIETCSQGIIERFVFFLGGSGVFISEDGYCLTNHHVTVPDAGVSQQGDLMPNRQYEAGDRFEKRVMDDLTDRYLCRQVRGSKGVFDLMALPKAIKVTSGRSLLIQAKSGDKIVTSGGIKGTIIAVKDDGFHLRVPPDNLRIEVVKSAVVSVTRDE